MGQPLRLLEFARPTTTPPRYLNSKHLPSCAQSQLCDVMQRFDTLMKDNPTAAAQVIQWADQILRIYSA